MLSVVGRCCILEMEDYTKSRPTQYGEEDVYVCENVYDESRRVIRSLPATGLKRYEYGKEIWHFFHKNDDFIYSVLATLKCLFLSEGSSL